MRILTANLAGSEAGLLAYDAEVVDLSETSTSVETPFQLRLGVLRAGCSVRESRSLETLLEQHQRTPLLIVASVVGLEERIKRILGHWCSEGASVVYIQINGPAIRALVRGMFPLFEYKVFWGGRKVVLSHDAKCLWVGDEGIRLSPTELKILKAFFEVPPGDVLSHRLLLVASGCGSPGSLTTAICRLNGKLGDKIASRHGQGYVLISDPPAPR